MSDRILHDQENLQKKYGTLIECNFDYYTDTEVAQIEEKVLSVYDQLDDNENGFFIMYEEAYIDKHSHGQDMVNTYKALIRFNHVIARTMEYAFYHPNTFVLITADHETGGLHPNDEGKFVYTNGDHSGSDVPVFAYGDGSSLFNEVTIENIQIPQTIAKFMGVSKFGDQTQYKPLS
jgi:alkaline phosphatase